MAEHSDEAITKKPAAGYDAEWQTLLDLRTDASSPVAESPLYSLYGPLCKAHHNTRQHGSFVIGHLAQSLDGRIATTSGISRWLSGAADLLHTHRMRALADAVVVGVNTVLHDDPQVTVRRCAGANPMRVVIDPERRLDGTQRIFRDAAASTLLLAAADRARSGEMLGQAEIVPVSRGERGLDPHEIRRILARRGLSWLFIEGGGITVSRFLAAGALDRLQITVAPLILGSGRPGIVLPEIADLRNCLRPRTRRFILGNDVMVECDFND
jgi:diaminohydroxyphosphoribosylaminopyrimidine deaminase/5-amino-6-(5-phosphoribosylamino)uracil reductase